MALSFEEKRENELIMEPSAILRLERTLSLYQIESELAELMALREEMQEAGETDLSAVNEQIAAYVRREIGKVDNIRAFVRHCKVMADAAEAEMCIQAARARIWKNRLDTIKDLCKVVLETTKKKKIEGRTGSIMLKGDGGKQAVTITDESLIPDEMCDWVGKISGDLMIRLRNLIVIAQWNSTLKELLEGMVRTPRKAAIAKALEDGPVAGARLEPRGQHVEVK